MASLYGIFTFTYIYHRNQPNVNIYGTSHGYGFGMQLRGGFKHVKGEISPLPVEVLGVLAVIWVSSLRDVDLWMQ